MTSVKTKYSRSVLALYLALIPGLTISGQVAAAFEGPVPQSAYETWQSLQGHWKGKGNYTITGPDFQHRGEYLAVSRFSDGAFCSGYETDSDSDTFCAQVTFRGQFQIELLESLSGYGFCYARKCSYRTSFQGLMLEEEFFLDGIELVKTGRKITREGYFVEWTERLQK